MVRLVHHSTGDADAIGGTLGILRREWTERRPRPKRGGQSREEPASHVPLPVIGTAPPTPQRKMGRPLSGLSLEVLAVLGEVGVPITSGQLTRELEVRGKSYTFNAVHVALRRHCRRGLVKRVDGWRPRYHLPATR